MSSKTLHFKKSNNAAPDEIIILQFSNKAVYIPIFLFLPPPITMTHHAS